MEIGSSIECREWDTHEVEFDDHDISLFRSREMFVWLIVDSLGSDLTRWKSRSIELRHFESIVVIGPEASGKHR